MIFLGCRPSKAVDLRRCPWLANYVELFPLYESIPAAVNHAIPSGVWDELGNDVSNDCTVAAAGHAIQVARYWGSKPPVEVDVPELRNAVASAYKALTTSDPHQDGTLSPWEVIDYWQSSGIAQEVCGTCVRLRPTAADWKAAIELFGFVYVALALPQSVLDAAHPAQYPALYPEWTDVSAPKPGPDAGTAHCVVVVAFKNTGGADDGVTVISWGKPIHMSWDFAFKYQIEAYTMLLPSWGTGQEPSGFDMAQLQADLDAYKRGKALPGPPATQPQAKEEAVTYPVSNQSPDSVPFLILLTLTDTGRNAGESAASSLSDAARGHFATLNGKDFELKMTFGQYDAYITGSLDSLESITSYVAWLNEQGYFATQTLVCVDPVTYESGHK